MSIKDLRKLAEYFSTIFATKHELEESINSLRSDMLSGFDRVMGELRAAREDKTILNGRSEDHENRLEKIEAIPSVAHELIRNT